MSGTMIQFTRGENPLRADKLNAALAERLWRNGDTMTGSLFLWRDPQAPSEAATKQYVDGQINSVVSGTVVRAVNGRAGYVQLNNGDITTALGYTPYDAANPAGYISAASAPVRSVAGKQGTVTLVHTDITDWAATLAPYALIASIPIAATTLPLIAGVAAVGVNGAWARADHVHPSEVTGASFLPTTYQSGGTVDYNTLLSSTTGLNSLHQFGGPLLSANGPSGGTADKGTVLVTYAANTSWTSQLFLGDGGNVVNQGIWYRQMDGGGTWTGMAWHRIITDEGGVMLGSLTLAGDPTAPLMAVTKQYVDVVKGAIEDYLPLTGGTLSGKLVAPTMIVQPGWSSGFTVNLYPDADGNFYYLQDGYGVLLQQDPEFGSVSMFPFASGAADAAVNYDVSFSFGMDGSFAATGGLWGNDDRTLGMYDDGSGNRWVQFNTGWGWLYNTQSSGPLQWLANGIVQFSLDNQGNLSLPNGSLTVARSSGGGANLTADASGGSGNWANLQLKANPSGACAINSFKYGLLRWTVEIGGTTAETGGNVGTDFALTAYNDDGTFLGYPVTVERGTGNVAITMGGLVVAGGVGFHGATPMAKPPVTGAKAGNAALASLLAVLVSYGLITDSTAA